MSKKLFALLFVMLMLCGAALADGITVTDMHGREIALDQPATRIVALTPSDCEILCAIGCEDALVGRGKYCDYPESISALPVVQSGAETNIEEILALDPQVVLMSDMSQTEEQAKLLEQNGVKVVISDANDIAGVYTAIRMIGALMAKDDAAEAPCRRPLTKSPPRAKRAARPSISRFPRSSGGCGRPEAARSWTSWRRCAA